MLTATGVDPSAAKPLVETTEQVGAAAVLQTSQRGRAASRRGPSGVRDRSPSRARLRLRQPPAPRCPLPAWPPPQAVTTAKPFVEQAFTFLTTTEPALLGQYALALVAGAFQ